MFTIYITRRCSSITYTIKVSGCEAAWLLFSKAVRVLGEKCYICLCDENDNILNGVLD